MDGRDGPRYLGFVVEEAGKGYAESLVHIDVRDVVWVLEQK